MNRHRIKVHIEELTLNGFGPADRYRISDAVVNELERLIAASPALFSQNAEISEVDGGTLNLRRGAGSNVIGKGIARSVHGGLKR